MSGHGVFIVFEGGEGAGKTEALAFLSDALLQDGHSVVQTREPGGTPEGLALRTLLLAQDASWEPNAELLLMTASRVQHVNRVILPALSEGAIVLCDRFLGSTLAYQGAGRGLPEADILDLHARHVGDLRPDITVLLDVTPEVGLSRSLRRLGEHGADEGRFEALDLPFHERVRRSFLAQAGDNTILVDASAAMDVVHQEVCARARSLLAGFVYADSSDIAGVLRN